MYRSRPTKIEILEYKDRIQWLFLRALGTPSEEQPFFAGERHPYDVSTDQTRLSSILTRDALFFGVAAATALGCLDANATWTILMQDWEAATIVLASRGKIPPSPHYFHLTLHNSYDSGMQAEMLKRFGLDPKSCPGETVLNRSLPFITDPIFTVSGQYAQDLTSEVLHFDLAALRLEQRSSEADQWGVATYHGPAVMYFYTTCESPYAAFRSWWVNVHTPVDGEEVELTSGVILAPLHEDRPLPAEFVANYPLTAIAAFGQDVEIWKTKRYRSDPVLCDGDGPINKLRKWYDRFYLPRSAEAWEESDAVISSVR